MLHAKKTNGGLAVILVAYHLTEADSAFALIDDFCQQMRLKYAYALVVDNGGGMKPHADDYGRHKVIRGENSAWEFSGWLSGMDILSGTDAPVVVLLNDSYRRNWSLSPLSLVYMRRMYRTACNGRVAGWLDNFSHLSPPRFNRRPNSRVVFLPTTALDSLSSSINNAIKLLRERTREGQSLFSEDEQRCLDRWTASQHGRWPPHTLQYRMQRIFLEHHMFDGLTQGQLHLFPTTWLESITYSFARRIFKEKR